MSAVGDFLNDPPAFMRANLVRLRGECKLAPGATGRFVLSRANGSAVGRRRRLVLGMTLGRVDAALYEIRHQPGPIVLPCNSAAGEFDAVWSGYQAGAAVQCTLGAGGAPIMLTPDLTGCTVVSATGPGGSASFSHYNLLQPAPAGGPRRTLDAAGMHAQAALDYPDRHAVLTKEDYYSRVKRGGAGRATVVGWRKNGSWRFWIQYVEDHVDVVRIRDVQQLTPGTRSG